MAKIGMSFPLYGIIIAAGCNTVAMEYQKLDHSKYLEDLDEAIKRGGYQYYEIKDFLIILGPSTKDVNPLLEVYLAERNEWFFVPSWIMITRYRENKEGSIYAESLTLDDKKSVEEIFSHYRYRTKIQAAGKSKAKYVYSEIMPMVSPKHLFDNFNKQTEDWKDEEPFIAYRHPLSGIVFTMEGDVPSMTYQNLDGSRYWGELDNATKSGGYNYYFVGDILIIPNPLPENENLIREVYIERLEEWIEMSDWMMFLNLRDEGGGVRFAESLTMPNRKKVKDLMGYYRYKEKVSVEGTDKYVYLPCETKIPIKGTIV